MPFFLLTPVLLESAEWALSSSTRPVQVEAQDEIHARLRASEHYWLPQNACLNKYSAKNPWCRKDLATAQLLTVIDCHYPVLRLVSTRRNPGRSSHGA